MSKEFIALPIDEFIPEILQKVSKGNLVITAAPGAGKTTRLPPALLGLVSGKILVLEPRRMAAIAAAHRIAEENGWELGEEIGYQVRFASKSNKNTRLIFMTEALLARQMLRDPELIGVDVVVLDEFHERSLHVDLTLGLLRELQELGRDIKIVVMSATLEAEKISSYLADAAVINVPGKLYELAIHHQKTSQILKLHHSFFDQLGATIRAAQSKTKRDILVFLPGVGEIERVRENISSWAETKNIIVVPLHGSLPLEEQRRALQKSARQRIILSTNISESSVTIDGVDTVIDSGLAKVMRQDLRTGFSRLELSRISLSSAIQRSGRSARQFPGTSYRMWNKFDEAAFAKSEVPEILRADLSESLLFLAAQGVSDFEQFTWFERPSAQSLERATRILLATGAIDSDKKLTVIGREILHFPLPVRAARLMIAGIELGAPELAAQIASLLQERDIIKKDAIAHFLGDDLECDLTARLDVFQQFLNKGSSRDAHHGGLQIVFQSYQQILQLAKSLSPKLTTSKMDPIELRQRLLISAYADRLCRRRKNTDRALMVGGRGVKIAADSLVKNKEFFIALNGVEGNSDSETVVSLASGIDKEFLFENYRDQIVKKKNIVFSEEKSQFYIQEVKTLFGLPLEEPTVTPATSEQVAEKLPEVLTENWNLVLKENQKLANWILKLEFLKAHASEYVQNILDTQGLKKELRLEAFTQACLGEKKMSDIFKKDLIYFFESTLPKELQQMLRTELPDSLQVPSGSHISIRYSPDKPPYIEVRIQEIFGWLQTPKVMFQKVPVVIHLLSPNFRPVQITSHLESFWKTGYAEVRKELRLKYPKHQWPENPADGVAEAKGRRRF